MILNEIIREYLAFNGYVHSLSVFASEVGLEKKSSFGRALLAREVGLSNDRREVRTGRGGKPLPLLYKMTEDLKRYRMQHYNRATSIGDRIPQPERRPDHPSRNKENDEPSYSEYSEDDDARTESTASGIGIERASTDFD